jgi:hypothetical protein
LVLRIGRVGRASKEPSDAFGPLFAFRRASSSENLSDRSPRPPSEIEHTFLCGSWSGLKFGNRLVECGSLLPLFLLYLPQQ